LLCGRCNHDNPEQYNYCGMCGMRLERPSAKPPAEPAKPVPVKEAPSLRVVDGSASVRTSILGLDAEPQKPRAAAPSASITGPSFLGLNSEPAPDADYLLEDDESSSHAGLWIALVLLLVVSVVGWRFGAQAAPAARQLYSAVLARVNPQPAAQAAAAAPPTDPATPPATDAPQPSAATSASDAPQPTGGASADAQPAASANPTSKPADEVAPKEALAESAKPSAEVKEEPAPSAKTVQPAKLAHASRPRPAEAVAPDGDAVLKIAQKYLHGQGVRQDCVTGLAYLKEAMKRPNAPADSQMGALYATGTCVPLDRLVAYRYFTSAMQLAPENAWLGMERDKLYGQMTSAERHQADKQ